MGTGRRMAAQSLRHTRSLQLESLWQSTLQQQRTPAGYSSSGRCCMAAPIAALPPLTATACMC